MSFGRRTFFFVVVAPVALVALAALGCSSSHGLGGTTSTGGAGGSPATTTSTSSTTTTGTGGGGGAGGEGGAAPTYEPSGFTCSTSKPSLNTDVVAITSPNCGTMAACHLAMQSGNGVYDQLVNRVAEECDDLRLMVNPGHPESSYVIHKLTAHNLCSPATTMPLDSAPLSPAHIQTIYDWICEGAPQN
jgi:hypothetical protein